MKLEENLKDVGKINKVYGKKKPYRTFMSHIIDNKEEKQESK